MPYKLNWHNYPIKKTKNKICGQCDFHYPDNSGHLKCNEGDVNFRCPNKSRACDQFLPKTKD